MPEQKIPEQLDAQIGSETGCTGRRSLGGTNAHV